MRFKKGFTLAEILIVLMVIGAIATMTIPSLMRGVTESQWKTAYKKTYNTLVNLTAMERIAGNLPSSNTREKGSLRMFESLNASLSVKDYAALESGTKAYDDGVIVTASKYKSCVKYTNSAGQSVDDDCSFSWSNGDSSPWIITEDNLAYSVSVGTGCGTKQDINSATKTSGALNKACAVVVVDVNGLSNGPNVLEPQIVDDKDISKKGMDTLTGDRYYIFIGKDGATAGSKVETVTGRIAADLK